MSTTIQQKHTTSRVGDWAASASDRVVSLLGNRWFFHTIVIIFIGSALLMAVTTRESIYDESYHLGIIDLYSNQWSASLENTNDSLGLGDVEFFGSFLFHYVMSFPYRLARMVVGGDYALLVVMRILNIAIVVGALYVWRHVLLKIKDRPALVHLSLMALSSLPLFIQISATVNYDNLLFIWVAAWAGALVNIARDAGTTLRPWLWFLVWGLLGSITKYTFVPVFAVVFIYLAIRHGAPMLRSVRGWGADIKANWRNYLVPAVLLLIGLYFVASRYVRNLFQFGNPIPDCGDVESVDYCMTWGPWARNFQFGENYDALDPALGDGLTVLISRWFERVSSTLLFIGVRNPDQGVLDTNGTPIALAILCFGMMLVLFCAVFLGGSVAGKFRVPLLLALAVHAVLLFYVNYSDLLDYGILMAFSARYFFPYLPFVILIAFSGLSAAMDGAWQAKARSVKVVFLVCVFVAMTQGAWALTFLYGVTPDWIAPESPLGQVIAPLHRIADIAVIEGR